MSQDKKSKREKTISTLETIELKIPAKTEYIALVRLNIAGIGARMELPVDDIEDLKIAVSEACNNSIRHAYEKSFQNNSIEIHFLIHPEKIKIKVTDHGHGFDTHLAQEYLLRQDDERTRGIGLGLFLMKTLMDDVRFSSHPERGTEVLLEKNI